jgi:hypothetical protein
VIFISAAAVSVAILLLVAGMITSNLVFVYVSIGVSVVAAVLLAAGVFRRRELFVRKAQPQTGAVVGKAAGAGAAVAAAPGRAAAGARAADARSADVGSGSQRMAIEAERAERAHVAAAERTSGRVLAGAGQRASGTARPKAASASPDSDVVLVVAGRRRFHVPGCVRLTGRPTEELTINEAVDEGFTACTTCLHGSVPGAWTAGRDADGDATVTAAGPEPAAWAATVAMPSAPDSGEPAAQSPGRATMQPAASGAGDVVAEAVKPGPVTPDAVTAKAVAPGSVEHGAVEPVAVTGAAALAGPGEPAKPVGAVVHQSEAGDKDEAGNHDEDPSELSTGTFWPGAGQVLPAALPDAGEDFHAHTVVPCFAGEAAADADADLAEMGTANAGDPAETVWVLRGVSRYHLRDCVLIVDDDVDAMTLAEAETDGCTPCRACHID